MKTLIIGVLAAVSLAAALPAAAQPFDAREHRQEQRIHQGDRSGALTVREDHRLQRREVSIRREDQVMRERHDGHLTLRDRHVLNHRLNRTSHAIYAEKHNDAVR